MNRTADAKHQYEQAVKLSPDVAGYHYNLARVLEALGDTDGAKAEGEKASALLEK